MNARSTHASEERERFFQVEGEVEVDPHERVTWRPELRAEDLWFAKPVRGTTTRPPPPASTPRTPSTPPIGDPFADDWFR